MTNHESVTRHCTCGITVGELLENFSADEGNGSTYDLAMEFADDETLGVYMAHHYEAQEARAMLLGIAAVLQALKETNK